LNELRRTFITARTKFENEMRAQVTSALKEVKQAYTENLIQQHNCASPAKLVTSWQSTAKIVFAVQIQDLEYFIVSGQEDELYLLQKDFLTPEDEQYLRGCIPVEGIADFLVLPSEETSKYNLLIKELAGDLLEMRLEFEEYAAQARLEDCLTKEVELKDEVEWLTGENKDLLMKAKQLAVANAALRQQVLQTKRPSIIGRDLTEEEKKDAHEHSGFMSNHDSFFGVVQEI
jgi:hypothetical protein